MSDCITFWRCLVQESCYTVHEGQRTSVRSCYERKSRERQRYSKGIVCLPQIFSCQRYSKGICLLHISLCCVLHSDIVSCHFCLFSHMTWWSAFIIKVASATWPRTINSLNSSTRMQLVETASHGTCWVDRSQWVCWTHYTVTTFGLCLANPLFWSKYMLIHVSRENLEISVSSF